MDDGTCQSAGNPSPVYDAACDFSDNTEKDIIGAGDLPLPNAPPEMPEPP